MLKPYTSLFCVTYRACIVLSLYDLQKVRKFCKWCISCLKFMCLVMPLANDAISNERCWIKGTLERCNLENKWCIGIGPKSDIQNECDSMRSLAMYKGVLGFIALSASRVLCVCFNTYTMWYLFTTCISSQHLRPFTHFTYTLMYYRIHFLCTPLRTHSFERNRLIYATSAGGTGDCDITISVSTSQSYITRSFSAHLGALWDQGHLCPILQF